MVRAQAPPLFPCVSFLVYNLPYLVCLILLLSLTGLPSAANSRPGTTFNEAVGEVATAMDVVNTLATGIRLDEYMRRYVCVMASSNIQPQAKAARTVELLVNAFEYHFIYARHLELLCMIFEEYGTLPCSEYFGTYRVELVISLFACVVDIHNFEIVMRRLTPFEAACVICRLGWLHIYNPMKPEGTIAIELLLFGWVGKDSYVVFVRRHVRPHVCGKTMHTTALSASTKYTVN